MTKAVLDDHLLRDVLGNEIAPGLRRILRTHEPATTNLYLLRLCRSVVAAPGGQLTGQWPPERRAALAQSLLELPEDIEVPTHAGSRFRHGSTGGRPSGVQPRGRGDSSS